ncbi:MAG: hypothetical protein HOH95_05050 [Dehalococcoidia bacterium]|nr:hypothetical protein [Dehalococcoidia bacterium]
MTVDNSRQAGQALMAGSALALLLFLVGAMKRSYAVIAIPVFAIVAVGSALGFWVGYTMAVQDWDDPADFGVDDEPDV